jgi:hypothetical protein
MASCLMIDFEPGPPEGGDDLPGPQGREALHFVPIWTPSRAIRGGRFRSRGNRALCFSRLSRWQRIASAPIRFAAARVRPKVQISGIAGTTTL